MPGGKRELPIGVFDSGMGGVSVLAEMLKILPAENFIYYADSANAPYGTKTVEEVRRFSLDIAGYLYDLGIKALVVACNTATSVAINELRAKLDIPVIGMEPALKPAVECAGRGRIVVMATPMTLKEQKFNDLLHRYDEQKEIIPLPCPGLVEMIEKGRRSGPEIQSYLAGLFRAVDLPELSVVVLGCTHYIFIRDEIRRLVDDCVQIIDGNCGTAKHLQRVLAGEGLLMEGHPAAAKEVRFLTSGDSPKVIPLCRELLAFMQAQTPTQTI